MTNPMAFLVFEVFLEGKHLRIIRLEDRLVTLAFCNLRYSCNLEEP